MDKITANLIVDSVRDCLPFWQQLGFQVTVEVPHANDLGFAILQAGDAELMLQGRASLADEMPELASGPLANDGVMLFVELPDLAPVRAAVEGGAKVVVAERETFYGKREIALRAPGGIIAIFAEPVEGSDASGA